MIKPCTKNVSEIICVEPHSSSEFPFNLRFRVNEKVDAIKGPCIYLIFHKNSLIYIGSYKPNHNKANLAKDRIWTHIASITMRGHRVTLSKDLNEPKFKDGKPKNELYKYLEKVFRNLRGEHSKRLGDRGCKTTKRRAEFAIKNWQSFRREFKGHDWVPISEFELVVYKLCSSHNITVLEKSLINKYSPACNYNSPSAKCEFKKIKVIAKITSIIKQFKASNEPHGA